VTEGAVSRPILPTLRAALLAIATMASLSGCAAVQSAKVETHAADESDGRVDLDVAGRVRLIDQTRRPSEEARWSRTPSQELLERVYREVPGGIYGSLHCSVTSQRSLRGCRFVEMDNPPDPRGHPILLRLIREFRLADYLPRTENIDYVSLHLRLSEYMPPPPPPPPPPPGSPHYDPDRFITQAISAAVRLRNGRSIELQQLEDWDGSIVQEAYLSRRVAGGAVGRLSCNATRERQLENCRIDFVNPPNRGFEPLLIRLAETLRLYGNAPDADRISEVILCVHLEHGRGSVPTIAPNCALWAPLRPAQ
jgi:hypothetical protein